MQRWVGRTALVTGAYSGIGAGISKALVKHGMNIIGCARNMDELQEFGKNCNLHGPGTFVPIKCDISKEQDVISMFNAAKDMFGGIDVCVNNVGIRLVTSILDGKFDHWKDTMDVNVLGLSLCTREAVNSMKNKSIDDGHIINIGSIFSHFVPKGRSSQYYSASKFAVHAVTEVTKNEIKTIGKDYRVTLISPGLVDTPIHYKARGVEAAKLKLSALRCLQPEDIAECVIYALGAPPHVNITEITIETTDPYPPTSQ